MTRARKVRRGIRWARYLNACGYNAAGRDHIEAGTAWLGMIPGGYWGRVRSQAKRGRSKLEGRR